MKVVFIVLRMIVLFYDKAQEIFSLYAFLNLLL